MTISQDPRELAERDEARAIRKKQHKCKCDRCIDNFIERQKKKIQKLKEQEK